MKTNILILITTAMCATASADTIYRCGNSYGSEPCGRKSNTLVIKERTDLEKRLAAKHRKDFEIQWEMEKQVRFQTQMAQRAFELQEELVYAHVRLADATQDRANSERIRATIDLKRTMLYDNGIMDPNNKRRIRNYYNSIAYDTLMR